MGNPISIRLDRDLEALVRRLSKRRDRTRSEIVREALQLLADQEEAVGRTPGPYELVSHLLGCADSGGRRLSERTGDKFRTLLRNSSHARRSR